MSNQYSNQYNKLLSCIKDDANDENHDFLYRVDDRGIVIEGYTGRKKYLIVPENIDGHPVYKIDDNAFYEDEKLKEITLPNTLRIIGKEAFACSALESAILPESLLIIDDGAFINSGLKSVNVPESVSIIGEEAFSGTAITSITIPRLAISIGARAFEHTSISSIKIPSNVKSISEEMFNGCRELHSVIIEGAETIEQSAFSGCKELKNIILPDTLISIEDSALNGTGITYLIVPQSVNYIGEDNFPEYSHVAILSDETEFYLGDPDCSDYSSVTLYCNQTNIKARKAAKEFYMSRKSLAIFAKISADYYKASEFENSFEIVPPKVFNAPNYCETKCEFYTACQANKAKCIKEKFEEILYTLSTREEKVIRLIYGINEVKEDLLELIMQAVGLSTEDYEEQEKKYTDNSCTNDDTNFCGISNDERFRMIKAKALRKLRHPRHSRVLRSTDIGVVLFSTNEDKYFNLWCAIFGEQPTTIRRQVELE